VPRRQNRRAAAAKKDHQEVSGFRQPSGIDGVKTDL